MSDNIIKAPLRFEPYLKSVIWGGDKICRYKGIRQDQPKIGESWEISAVPGHESVVADGPFKGETLTALIDKFGERLLGTKVMRQYGGKFPLLIKIIDANDDLSVQVHPDDTLAMKRHNCAGKTEMWYIIGNEPGAKIYAGLNTKMDGEEYVRRVKEGTFAETLAWTEPAPGDVYFIPAGRVHAIGAGCLLAEIQQSSDITYRIYDYDRRDAQGNTRQLHTEEAKDAINYEVLPDYRNPRLQDREGVTPLVECPYFNTYKVIADGSEKLPLSPESFTILICTEGACTLHCPGGDTDMRPGMTLLLPAAISRASVEGKATLLLSNCL